MTEPLAPTGAVSQGAGVSRRQLVKAGAWAAPVVAVAFAAPAYAAQSDPVPVPVALLTGAVTVSNANTSVGGGPVRWSGQINYVSSDTTAPPLASVPYVVQYVRTNNATDSPGAWTTVTSGTAAIAKNGNFPFVAADIPDTTAAGYYRVRIMASGSENVLTQLALAGVQIGQLNAGTTAGFPVNNGGQLHVSITAAPGQQVVVTARMDVTPALGAWADAPKVVSGTRTLPTQTYSGTPLVFSFPEYKKANNAQTYNYIVTLSAPGFANQTFTGSW